MAIRIAVLCLLAIALAAYEGTGPIPGLDGRAFRSGEGAEMVVAFAERGLVYANVIARAGCHAAQPVGLAQLSGDARQEVVAFALLGHDAAGTPVHFRMTLLRRREDEVPVLLSLHRVER